MPHLLIKLEKGLSSMEAYIVVCALLLMLILALGQIIARNLFDSGFPRADALLRYLVLLISFFGAVLAITERRHIKLDIISVWLPEKWRSRLEVAFDLVSSVVCGVFSWAAARFWQMEWQVAPTGERWIAAMAVVLPVSFALLTVHFALQGVLGSMSATEAK